ncbi:hypothetical protein [Sphingomonas sp. TREG-RG-20F-R18-01]|uniref:hypothetical protein n=1 Tax=Sphingomonas sp. TREG-RG-20F-R18-01 TaxID=2914982 RepID=UPI001F58AE43|nr:hypothetical protein [Sphingomonas sp. TREG-RG-20F-R18-01]
MTVASDYRAVTTLQAFPHLSTQSMFDCGKRPKEASPIDTFLEDTEALNKLFMSFGSSTLPKPLGSLVLLGYTSAVESFLRAVIRRIVIADEIARKRSEPLSLSFGAAFHHERALMPEALLERFSFAGRRGIRDAFAEVLGIEIGGSEMEAAMNEFARICEIRHCCVHRSGRLGSQNAMKLGLQEHSTVLERPFYPSVDDLQDIADLLRTFVKTVNNFLFAAIIDRTVHRGGETVPELSWSWSWGWREDRKPFQRYYDVFASATDMPKSPSARSAYESFSVWSGPGGDRWLEKRRAKKAVREEKIAVTEAEVDPMATRQGGEAAPPFTAE